MNKLVNLLLLATSYSFSQNIPKMGLIFDDEAYDKTPLKARNVAFQDVVSEQPIVSLRQFAPMVRDQGGYGTCVGWTTT